MRRRALNFGARRLLDQQIRSACLLLWTSRSACLLLWTSRSACLLLCLGLSPLLTRAHPLSHTRLAPRSTLLETGDASQIIVSYGTRVLEQPLPAGADPYRHNRMVKVGVLAGPWLASTDPSGCT